MANHKYLGQVESVYGEKVAPLQIGEKLSDRKIEDIQLPELPLPESALTKPTVKKPAASKPKVPRKVVKKPSKTPSSTTQQRNTAIPNSSAVTNKEITSPNNTPTTVYGSPSVYNPLAPATPISGLFGPQNWTTNSNWPLNLGTNTRVKSEVKAETAEEKEAPVDNLAEVKKIKHDDTYMVTDKKAGYMYVFDKTGKELDKFKVSTGAAREDYNTMTKVDKNGKILDKGGNMSTGAGIYTIKGTFDYNGAPSFQQTRDTDNSDSATAIHAGDITKGSNGCIRMRPEDLKRLSKYAQAGKKHYILPEKEGNRFIASENGVGLAFTSKHGYGDPNSYDDDINIQADKSRVPIKFEVNKNDFKNEDTYSKARSAFDYVESNKDALQDSMSKVVGRTITDSDYKLLAAQAIQTIGNESDFGKAKFFRNALDNVKSAVKSIYGTPSTGLGQIKTGEDHKELQDHYKSIGYTDALPMFSDASQDEVNTAVNAVMHRLAYTLKKEKNDYKDKQGNKVPIQQVLDAKYLGRYKQLKSVESADTVGRKMPEYIKNLRVSWNS